MKISIINQNPHFETIFFPVFYNKVFKKLQISKYENKTLENEINLFKCK